MHQTFYIDIDEEITSIVERLRKTEVPEAVIVVPKRALLIQSIVNLKLLRKVADDLGLKISIITQDKLGKMLVKKAGISIQQKLEDNDDGLDDVENEMSIKSKREYKKEIEMDELAEVGSRKKRDLEKIGSADYFVSGKGGPEFPGRENDSSEMLVHDDDLISDEQSAHLGWEELERIKEQEISPQINANKDQRVMINRPVVSSREVDLKKNNAFSMDVSVPSQGPARNASYNDAGGPARSATHSVAGGPVLNASQSDVDGPARNIPSVRNNINIPERSGRRIGSPDPALAEDFAGIPFSSDRQIPRHNSKPKYEIEKKAIPRDEQLENFFYASNFSDRSRESYSSKKQEVGQKSKGVFLRIAVIFGAIVLVFGLAYIAYLYVPKATVTIFAKKEVKSADIEITGDVNHDEIDYDKSTIPAKLMEFNEEVAKTFNATGLGNVSNQKAKGKVTIYNEFSSSPQPLVATTRFLSEDQKVFRLVQSVTVPGTTKVGEEIKPGVLEVDVIADEAGDGYNIGATNFTIPGFKSSGNDKHTKIYAKSEASMSGGGSGNDTVKLVTDKDISDAKDKISLEINGAIKNKIKDGAAGMIILDDAIVVDEPVYRVSNSAGETADSFEIKIQAHARALVFSESDIKKIANSVIAKSGNGKINIDSGSVIIDYGKANADFKLGVIDIKMHASNVMQPNIDLENLKRGILGKNNDELGEYLKTYSNIEKAEVEYFPQVFTNKIPLNEKRVKVILNATMPE